MMDLNSKYSSGIPVCIFSEPDGKVLLGFGFCQAHYSPLIRIVKKHLNSDPAFNR
jgi:hypothetical protein